MPIDIEYTADRIGVIFHATGKGTADDIIKSGESIFRRENFKDLRYWIIDREKCTEYAVGLSAMHEIAKLDKEAAKINPELLVAIVSRTDIEHIRSIIYKAEMIDGGFRTELFHDRESAEHWIQSNLSRT